MVLEGQLLYFEYVRLTGITNIYSVWSSLLYSKYTWITSLHAKLFVLISILSVTFLQE